MEGVRLMNAKEVILKYYYAFNRQDRNAILELLSNNVVHEINQGITEIGKEAFNKFLDKMDHSYLERLEKIVVMVNEDGSRASAEFDVHGTYLKTDGNLPKANGQKYVIRAGAFFEIEKSTSLIKRVTTYYNMPEWIRLVSK